MVGPQIGASTVAYLTLGPFWKSVKQLGTLALEDGPTP